MTERSVLSTDHGAATPAARPVWLGSLAPGGFACVMATGIVPIGRTLLASIAIGWSPFATNAVLYPAAWVATVTARLALCVPSAAAPHGDQPGTSDSTAFS